MAEFMTIAEIASYLRFNKRTIYRLLARGRIPASKIGNRWRFDKAIIDEWLQHKSVGGEATVLVIDDEDLIRELFVETLGKLGHKVIGAKHGSQGLELIKQLDFDMVFLDLKLPGMNGAEIFAQIKTIKPNLPVIIITGYPDSELMARALAWGPFGVMKKPFGKTDIIAAVEGFSQTGKVSREVTYRGVSN